MEKTGEEQIRIDKLYEKDLNFNEIIKNPVLQPIAESSAIYESQGLIIQRALFEFTSVKDQITNLMKENPTYQQTIIMSKIRDILNYSQQIIHSQDIQRESIKRCINDMIKIVERNYDAKGNQSLSLPSNLEMRNMSQFIQDKIEDDTSFDDIKEIEEQEKEDREKEEKLRLKKQKSEELDNETDDEADDEPEEDEDLESGLEDDLEEEPKMKKPRKENPWFKHVEKYKKEHPGIPSKIAMRDAKKTYIPLNELKQNVQNN